MRQILNTCRSPGRYGFSRGWKAVIAAAIAAFLAILAFPWLFHYYQVYDPLNSFFGPPVGLSGQLIFYDANLQGYRSLTLPSLKESPFFDVPGTATNVSFSTDGRFVLYRHAFSIVIKDRLLDSEYPLNAPFDAQGLTISPNARAVAMITSHRKKQELLILPGPASNPIPKCYVPLKSSYIKASWSHDTTTLYLSTSEGTVTAYNLEAKAQIRMFPGRKPSVSPTGTTMAFYRGKGKNSELVLLDLLQAKEWIVCRGTDVCRPVWSPDGHFIAFFEPVRGLWKKGPPCVRLRILNIKSESFSTLLQGRAFSMPERLTWIPKND